MESSLFAADDTYGRVPRAGHNVTYPNSAGTGGQDISNEKISGRNPFTVEVWAKGTTLRDHRMFAGKGDTQFALKTYTNERIEMQMYSNGNWYGAISDTASAASFKDGNWHHIAGTFDGTDLKLYLDGKMLAQTSLPAGNTINVTNYAFAVGRDVQSGSGRDSDSDIANAHVFSRALSDAELTLEASAAHVKDDSVIFWADYSQGEIFMGESESTRIPDLWR